MLASFKKKRAVRDCEEFVQEHRVQARVIRKPKGWVPEWNTDQPEKPPKRPPRIVED